MDESTFLALRCLLEQPLSAPAVMRRLEKAGDRVLPIASLYRSLNRALDAGWVRILSDKEAISGRGRPGQRYGLTAAGVVQLRSESTRLRAIADDVLRACAAPESEA